MHDDCMIAHLPKPRGTRFFGSKLGIPAGNLLLGHVASAAFPCQKHMHLMSYVLTRLMDMSGLMTCAM